MRPTSRPTLLRRLSRRQRGALVGDRHWGAPPPHALQPPRRSLPRAGGRRPMGGGRAGWERRGGGLRWAMVASMIIGETDSGRGGGSGGVAVRFHTGSGPGLSPLVSPRAPGTTLIHGHTAPLSLRPHTAHGLGGSRPHPVPQFLPVARPRSGINTLIRVSPQTEGPMAIKPQGQRSVPRGRTAATIALVDRHEASQSSIVW
jgi:hypothetical protein